MKFRDLLSETDKALFPDSFTCDICGIETFGGDIGGNICTDCIKTLNLNNGNTCPVCGRKTVRNEICSECKAHAPAFKKAVSPFVYDGGVIMLIAKFKKGQGYLKEYFADMTAAAILKELPTVDFITCVPMTAKAVIKRGYNQSELLATAISRRTGINVAAKIIEKIKDTSEQKSLSGKERAENLAGCFRITDRAAVKGKSILLVDDVLTTGATANTISKKLIDAGAKCVYLATVASVEYKSKKKKTKKGFFFFNKNN